MSQEKNTCPKSKILTFFKKRFTRPFDSQAAIGTISYPQTKTH